MESFVKIHIALLRDRYNKVLESPAKDAFEEQHALVGNVLEIKCLPIQAKSLLEKYPEAVYSESTNTIALLPQDAKEKILEIAIRQRSASYSVIDAFLNELKEREQV